jgi:hypothetical protein
MMIFVETLGSTDHNNDSFDDTNVDFERNNVMHAGLCVTCMKI